MSEYQYYEFLAVDRPLDKRAMDALRAISSRAQITPTSLINVYHFGDFKGDPDRLMDAYFDAFLYVANWGHRRFMLRLPERLFDLATSRAYGVPSVLETRAGPDHVVLDFQSEEEGGGDFEEGEGWMASLIPLRAELMAGDHRCLYLAWLSGVDILEVEDDQPEPPVPPGLGDLSAPLKRFAEFLRLDPDLIEVAARDSSGNLPGAPPPQERKAWLASLPAAEKDRLLDRLLQGETATVASELLQRLRRDHASHSGRPDRGEPRTAGALREARDSLDAERRRKAEIRAAQEKAMREREQAEKWASRERERAEEKARRERERAQTHAVVLDTLAGRETDLWWQVEDAIETKKPERYDFAVTVLKELCELGRASGGLEEVAARIRELRQRHGGKSRLIQRLDQAGLPR